MYAKKIVAMAGLTALLMASILPKGLASADGDAATGSQFMDFFGEMPIVEPLSSDCWGAAAVGARDQGNGLEDKTNKKYCYWDGKILKDEETGKYYLFGSRWNESEGHNGWYGSNAVYAVSDNLYGPYTEKGLLWPNDQGGKGHNVWPLKLHDGDKHGKYAIIVSETRDGDVFVSDSLDGPWKNIGKLKVNEGYWQSNTCVIARPDGKYEIINRNGEIAISNDLLGTYKLKAHELWKNVRGMPTENIEDAVVWYCDGLYHCTVNKWDSRRAYYLTSENGIDGWEKNPGSAYMPDDDFLRYTDGTVNHWNKIERPNVYIEDNEVKAMTFSVIDVAKDKEKGKDNHGSKVIVVPFDGKAQNSFAHTQWEKMHSYTSSKKPVADAMAVFSKTEHSFNFGASDLLTVQKSTDESYGLFGEKITANDNTDAANQISYLKFDVSDYDPENSGKVVLSLIYGKKYTGASKENSVIVCLADNDWTAGKGKGKESDTVGDKDLTWDKKPALLYDPNDIAGTTANSATFSTSKVNDLGYNVEIDVTKLLRNRKSSDKEVTFAICENKDNSKMGFHASETKVNTPMLFVYPKGTEEPDPTVAPATLAPKATDLSTKAPAESKSTTKPQASVNPSASNAAQPPQESATAAPLAQPTVVPQTSSVPAGNAAPSENVTKAGDIFKDESSRGSFTVTSAEKGTLSFTAPIDANVEELSIPATVTINGKPFNVTKIEANAFKNNKKIKKITIEKNVTEIGENAFYGCKNLKNIIIKTTGLTKKTVGNNAFGKINQKAKITVPKSVLKSYRKMLKSKGVKGKKQKITK